MRNRAFVILVMAVLLPGLLAACGSGGGPLGGAAAIVTAPITAPVLFIEARRNGRGAFLERARNNRRPAPLLDPVSEEMAAATLELALGRGEPDRGVYWENNRDAHGRRAGGVTVLATWHTAAGRTCREVLVETVAEGRPTDQRVRTHCQDEKGPWEALDP